VLNSLLAGNLAGNFIETSPLEDRIGEKIQFNQQFAGKFPAQKEQGIFLREQGILRGGAGNFGAQQAMRP
jgi:hypothetical protein